MIHDDYVVKKNGTEYLTCYNEVLDGDSIFFSNFRNVLKSVIDDINGKEPLIIKNLRFQKDYG